MASRTEKYRQLTVRFPIKVWADLVRTARAEQGISMNDVVVTAVAAELDRQRRASLLSQIATERTRIEERWGVAEDSVPYIRALRDGHRDGGDRPE
jgi:hypothetical protein